VFFLINDSETAWEGSVSVCAAGDGERWDPETGAVSPVAAPENIALALGPYGGVFYRFTQARQPERVSVLATTAARSKIELPGVKPTAAHAQYLEAAVTAVPEIHAWTASGKVMKSDTDMFFFLAFNYADPVDLSQATSISFDAQTPPGQHAGTVLFVILRDKNGVEYFADTGYPLYGEAAHRCTAPISLFDHAGFSAGPDGPFDFSAVSGILIGWGGYKGAEGDTVEFTIGNPEVASANPEP
jgi:hypothetical protein